MLSLEELPVGRQTPLTFIVKLLQGIQPVDSRATEAPCAMAEPLKRLEMQE